MKYANDLPDGFCVVANRLENGTKSLKQLASLIKAISKLELDFAKNLDKLVEKTKKAAAGMAFEVATTHDAWGTLLSETGRLAKTHSEIGLALNDKCATAMKVFEKGTSGACARALLCAGRRASRPCKERIFRTVAAGCGGAALTCVRTGPVASVRRVHARG